MERYFHVRCLSPLNIYMFPTLVLVTKASNCHETHVAIRESRATQCRHRADLFEAYAGMLQLRPWSCAIAHARQRGQLLLWSLLRSSLPEHLQHLGRSIGAIASVQQVLCVGHDKSARLVSSEERTHLKSRTGVNRTDVRLAVTAIMFMHTTAYITHILFTQSRAECTLGLK